MFLSILPTLIVLGSLAVPLGLQGADKINAVTVTNSEVLASGCLSKLLGVEPQTLASRVDRVKAGAIAGAQVGSMAHEMASALVTLASIPSMEPADQVLTAMELNEESPSVNIGGAEISLFALPGAAVGAVAGAAFVLTAKLDKYRVYELPLKSGGVAHVLVQGVLGDEVSESCQALSPFLETAAGQGAEVSRSATDPRGPGTRWRSALGCFLRWTSPLVAAALGVGGYYLESSVLFPQGIETHYALTALASVTGLGGALLVGTCQAWLGWAWNEADLTEYLKDLILAASPGRSGSHSTVILIVPWFRSVSVQNALAKLPGSRRISSEEYLAQVLARESGASPEQAASFLASLQAAAASSARATTDAVLGSVGRATQSLLNLLNRPEQPSKPESP